MKCINLISDNIIDNHMGLIEVDSSQFLQTQHSCKLMMILHQMKVTKRTQLNGPMQ
jgi:hypothetical protein